MKTKFELLKICVCMSAVIVLFGLLSPVNTFAYFDRGDVGVSLGISSLNVEAGKSVNVSVSFSPASSSQLPGCGLAECPQICGEKECLDENGECTCNGNVYETYYASADTYSSNTSVASASYSNGVVTVYGISSGTAVITVTASLRQFTSTSAEISVTVSEAQTLAAETENNQETASHNSESVIANQVSGSQSEKQGSESKTAGSYGNESAERQESSTAMNIQDETGANDENTSGSSENEDIFSEYTVLNSDRGKVILVPAVDAETVGNVLKEIAGTDIYADFQCKNQADTIEYAWEFLGTDIIGSDYDVNLAIELSQNAFSGLKQNLSNSVYIASSDSASFPGTGSLNIRVAEYYENGTLLYIYRPDSDGNLISVAEGVEVTNGYVEIASLSSAGKLILTTDKASGAAVTEAAENEGTTAASAANAAAASADEQAVTGSFPFWIIIAAAVVIAAIVCIFIFVRKKKNDNNN